MTRRIQPNTVLPKGAELIPVIKKKVAGWVEMEYDAKITYRGIVWLRVRGGFGSERTADANNNREDWVADLHEANLSVSDYQWREPRWGTIHAKNFFHAIDLAILNGVRSCESSAREMIKRAKRYRRAVKILREAAATITEDSQDA